MADEDWRQRLPAWVRERLPLDEAGWLTEFSMVFVLRFLDAQPGNARRLWLFAAACCRRVWHLLQVGAARRIVELAEAYADGEATEADLQAANNSPDFAELDALYQGGQGEAEVQMSACVVDALQTVRGLASPSDEVNTYLVVQNTSRNPAGDFMRSSRDFRDKVTAGRDEAEFSEKEKLLRDIFGNPFRPVAFQPEWRTSTVHGLARQMYQSRDLSPMPILADALQDAGCGDEDVLNHCLGGGPHVRGCWVVDLVLGKERPSASPPAPPKQRPPLG
jgi:hypothetical protein